MPLSLLPFSQALDLQFNNEPMLTISGMPQRDCLILAKGRLAIYLRCTTSTAHTRKVFERKTSNVFCSAVARIGKTLKQSDEPRLHRTGRIYPQKMFCYIEFKLAILGMP